MEARVKCFILLFCLGLSAWLYIDLKSTEEINYSWHSFLVNSTNGAKIEPRTIYDLTKIIRKTDAYVNSTNALERLYDLEYNTNVENPFVPDQVYSSALDLLQSGQPVANQTKCARDLAWILDQLTAHQHYQLIRGRLGLELTQYMDSFGKLESSFYSGIISWPGSYKQCMKTSLDGDTIRTRYCTAKMRPKQWPRNETVYPRTRIRMGICLPESCDTMSFKRHKQSIESLAKFDLNQFYRENLDFESMFCLPDERSPVRQMPRGGRVFLYLVAGWLTLIFAASTAYELVRSRLRQRAKESTPVKYQPEFWIKGAFVNSFFGRGLYEPCQQTKPIDAGYEPADSLALEKTFGFKLIEALSVHSSIKAFKTNAYVQQQSSNGQDQKARVRVNLCCLSSIKFIMAFLVVLGHSAYLNSVYSRNLDSKVEMSVGKLGKMVLSFSKTVDTFFIFFGMLTAYTILRKFNTKQLSSPLTWLGINAGILFRLSPVFMLVYWYTKLVSPYTGAGPWWDYGVYRYSMRGHCLVEPWWTSILYLGRSGPAPASSCVLPGWFLIVYCQLALMIPMVVYILCKLPNHISRYLLLAFPVLVSSLQFAIKVYRQKSIRDDAYSVYGAFLVNLVEKFETIGSLSSLGRVGCVTTSCYFGYLLRRYELGEIRKWPRWFCSRLTLVILVVLHLVFVFAPLIGHIILESGNHIVSLNEFVSSFLAITILWPILNAMLIINAVTVYNRTAIVRFLSHSAWHSANKLGFCIYLIHWEVIFIGVTMFDYGPAMGSMSDIMKMWPFGIFYSILLAFLIHILFEAPINSLGAVIVSHIQKESRATTEDTRSGTKQLDCVGTPTQAVKVPCN